MTLRRQIAKLTLPAIVSNITVPLLGLADTAISGHLGSEAFIGAIAVGSMMMNVVFWLFGFLRMGTTGLTAQTLGSNSKDDSSIVLLQALVIALACGVVLLVFMIPVRGGLLLLIGADANVESLGSKYFTICIWEAPAMLATMAISGWFVGMQNTVIPMIIAISVNVLNIALSLLLVFVVKVGFEGVAYGTLTANYIGLALAAWFLVRFMRARELDLSCNPGKMKIGFGRFFRVNTDLFLRSMCVMGVSLALTSLGARLGVMVLAANTVMMQFFTFFSYFMDGLAFAAEALSGKYAGARDMKMLHKTVRLILKYSIMMALAFFCIYAICSRAIVGIITNETAVINTVMHYKMWIWLIPPVTVMAFVYDGFYIGLTATRQMLIVTVIAAAVFIIVAMTDFDTWQFGAVVDNDHLWLAFMSWLAVRGIGLALWSPSTFRLKVSI